MVARCVCVSHIWAQVMTITITVQNSAPYFLRKRRKRNLLYIYLYIYSTSHITPQPSKCTCGKSDCNCNCNCEGIFLRSAICDTPNNRPSKKNIAKHLRIPNKFTNFADVTRHPLTPSSPTHEHGLPPNDELQQTLALCNKWPPPTSP